MRIPPHAPIAPLLALSLLAGCGETASPAPTDAATVIDTPSPRDVVSTPDATAPTDTGTSDAARADVPVADVARTDAGAEQCFVTFHFLQKDAYREGPGRTSDLWPPHTTTAMEVTCTPPDASPMVVASAYMENHGTLPSAVDMTTGRPILQETRRVGPLYGTRAELLSLLAAYRTCECAPGTMFLSMDALRDTAVQSLVGALVTYVQAHLTCTGATTPAMVTDALQAGHITDVITALPSCHWGAGSDLAGGFNDAITRALSATLSQYHVCNNDAFLQAQLVGTFEASHTVRACDNTSAACHSPRWFYAP